MSEEKNKKCPFCAEEINVNAIKCKHCGSDLTQTEKDVKETKKKKGSCSKILGYIFIFLFFCVIIGLAIDSDNPPSDVKTNSSQVKQQPKTEQDNVEQLAATVELHSLIDQMKNTGFIVKYEITGVEDELLYLYMQREVWMVSTREDKINFLKTFGEKWEKIGKSSVVFFDVMTNDKLGRWSLKTPQIFE